MSDFSSISPHIFLYGPPGSGKSATGHALAEALALPFLDLDDSIAARAGRNIPEIFEAEGESGFRGRERQALETALTGPASVIALGGGALLDHDSRLQAGLAGPIFCLNAPLDVLFFRIQSSGDSRPLLNGNDREALRSLLESRREHYFSFGELLDTDDQSPDAVAWEIQIRLGRFHVRGMGDGYDVRVEPGGLQQGGNHLRALGLAGPIGIVSDDAVAGYYGASAQETLKAANYQAYLSKIPQGEASKNIQTAGEIWEAFLEAQLERRSTIIGLGGGVVTDLAGFAAATYLRGVQWVALPTSLLAMVDASLGGKTGIDLPQGKNLVGAFYPPKLVLADPDTLATLPDEELRSGMAEVVKHGIIGDPALFELCEQGLPAVAENLPELVRRAVAVKVKVILVDPYEKGIRASLNLGHTIGHAVEAASGFDLRHGEAVAIGIVAEARLAEEIGLAEAGLSARIINTLKGLGLPTEIPSNLDPTQLKRRMYADKKKVKGQLRFALPRQIGEVQVGIKVETEEEDQIIQGLR